MIDWDQLTLPEVLFRGLDDLEGNDLVTTLFEAADDLSDESTLDTVRLNNEQKNKIKFSARLDKERLWGHTRDKKTYLDHDVSTLSCRHFLSRKRSFTRKDNQRRSS